MNKISSRMRALLAPKPADEALSSVIAFLADHDVELIGETREELLKGISEALEALPELAEAALSNKEITELIGSLLALGAAGWAAKKVGKWWARRKDAKLSRDYNRVTNVNRRRRMKDTVAAHKAGGSNFSYAD